MQLHYAILEISGLNHEHKDLSLYYLKNHVLAKIQA